MVRINSLASRGWLTIFCAIVLSILSLIVMSSHTSFSRVILTAAVTVLPIGIYEVILGRQKLNNISLKEYRSDYEDKNKYKYIMLGLVGSVLAGLANRLTNDLDSA